MSNFAERESHQERVLFQLTESLIPATTRVRENQVGCGITVLPPNTVFETFSVTATLRG